MVPGDQPRLSSRHQYAAANPKGQRIQVSKIGATITHPPNNRLYKKHWHSPLSPSHYQPIDAPGRPDAQMQYHLGWSAAWGTIPVHRVDMWKIFYNYYLNLIRDTEQNLQMLLEAMGNLGLWKNTVVVSTADHGELSGSHGASAAKGRFLTKRSRMCRWSSCILTMPVARSVGP